MYKITELPNKIRVVTSSLKDRDSASIGVWVGVGGRFEGDHNKGAAHFIEHLLFKGSEDYSCDEIKQLIEGVGGNLNAFTSEEQTCYFAKVPARHLPQTFDILADMVFRPNLDSKDVEKERTVILEEIKMYHDLPQYYVVELLDGLLWPEHPLGTSLAGNEKSVGGMSVHDLRSFYKKHYSSNNIVIASSGTIKHEDLVKLVRKKLLNFKEASHNHYVPVKDKKIGRRIHCHHKPTEQMHLAIGTRGLKTNHKDLYALGVLNIILGGNMSSRLFNEVREKRGLAYSIASSSKSLDDTGLFMIRAGVDNSKLVEAAELITKVFRGIQQKGVTANELKRAKDYFQGQFLLGLEDTLDHMLWIGEVVISKDHVRTLKDAVQKIRQVNFKDVLRVANEHIPLEHFNLSVVGPVTDDQEKSLSQLFH